MSWTAEQILALAPDAASAKSGQSLATDLKWQNCARSALPEHQVIWGECQGSGSKPYRTQIDLSEPAFRCSCPSRKFPCKHGLGLFLLLAQSPDGFVEAAEPDWVTEWLDGRQQRQAKKQEKAAEGAASITDPEAQAKRHEKRAQKVDAGVGELRQWLEDLVRRGLATVPEMAYGQWDQVAARMVDAQAAGLARRVQLMAGTAHSGAGWPDRLLGQLGDLNLLLESYQRIETLPPNLQADIRSQLGWTMSQEEVLANAAQVVSDRWLILGQRDEQEDRLRIRRIWLQGETSQQVALILLFAHGQQPFEITLLPGMVVPAELTFFPSAYPQRAIVKARSADPTPMTTPPESYATVEQVFHTYSHALSQSPWIERVVVSLEPITVIESHEQWYLRDRENHGLPIAPSYSAIFELVALAGGHPIGITGEWDGREFYPLSAWIDQQFVVL
jgi:hypothetical protein